MKRILSLFVVVTMLASVCMPAFAKKGISDEMGAAKAFIKIIDELPDSEDDYGEQYVYMTDINNDSIDEMIILYTDHTQMNMFYCDIYSYTSGGSYDCINFREVLYFFSGNFLTEKVVMFRDGNSLILRTTGEPNTLSAADFRLAKTVDYMKITINDDGSFKTISESYNDTDGEDNYWGEIKYIKESSPAEKKAMQSKYEKGSSELLYEFCNGGTELRVANAAQSKQSARKKLSDAVKILQNEQYKIFDDKSKSLSDKDKLKIQNLIHRIEIKDEPTNIASMNEEAIIDMTSNYTLRRDYDTKYVDSLWMGGGGNNFYKVADVEGHIYNNTGVSIDLAGHRCTNMHCGADYDADYLSQLYGPPENIKKTIAKVKNHEYFVSTSNEGDAYQFPIIKNIYSLDAATCLVVYECTVFDAMGNPYDHTKLYKNLDSVRKDECYQTDQFDSYAIIGVRKQGNDNSYYMIEQGGKGLITAEQAKKYIKVSTAATNITPDYKKAKGFKTADEFIQYLRTLLEGSNPNDSAKAEIVKFMEYAIERIGSCKLKAKSGKVSVDAAVIESVIAKCKKLKDSFEDLANDNDITLNKDIDLCIRIDADGAKLSKGVTVVFDESVTEWTAIADKIKIVLDSDSHAVIAASDAINAMLSGGVCSVKIERDKNKYTITYLDSHGKQVATCPSKLTFALSSDSEYNVVYYERDGKKENWSGQYNSADSAIEFMTAFSGVYYVEENDTDITDIADLSDEEQQAIRFMVSRGYFTLADSKFNPYGLLSRNDFTKALVSIFYELDYEAKTTFADVAADDAYYTYIASSQNAEIIKGFEDNTFRGTNNTTKEEVVSIAARTIAEQKDYTYPQNADDYIAFADSADITYWEGQKGEIALAVREGLIARGGTFAPKADITRVEAALILYRLFNILYEVTGAGADAGSLPIIPVAAGSGVVVAAGAAAWWFIKRRKVI